MNVHAAETAASLMNAFAARTGLTSAATPRRYLWTDAFAVCNFLALARIAGGSHWMDLALRLVDQVHRVLGRYRADDSRSGWLSGLGEHEGARHPTLGGLRIGKPLPERAPGESFDERLEWERDGQYFHYLTKWMHALDQVSRATRDPRFNSWAHELAAAAHLAFTGGCAPGRIGGPHATLRRRMAWKMSTDLSRPLVASMGQHDPLDGWITCLELESTASVLGSTQEGPDLRPAIEDFAAMAAATDLRTADPLGLGGLLSDACRVALLAVPGSHRLVDALLVAAHEGLALYLRQGELRAAASRRLAFRELGLAIGLAAVEWLRQAAAGDRRDLVPEGRSLHGRFEAFAPDVELGPSIVEYWLVPEHQESSAWSEHRDINEVMLATSLLPEGFSVLRPPGGGTASP